MLNFGVVTIASSTFSGNSARGCSGCIKNNNDGALTLTNALVSRNSAGVDGGGITNLGAVNASFVATADDGTSGQGGGMFAFPRSIIDIKNSIVGITRLEAPGRIARTRAQSPQVATTSPPTRAAGLGLPGYVRRH